MSKVSSNKRTDVWASLVNAFADPESPTAAELNGATSTRLTPAIAWDGTTFPTATESDTIDDLSLDDAGNATTRGSTSYEATLNFFRPYNNLDTTSDFGLAYQMFRTDNPEVFLTTRVLQRSTSGVTPAAAGQWISVFRGQAGSNEWDIEGDDSIKYSRGFLSKGFARIYTQVKNSTPVSVALEDGSVAPAAVGDIAVYRAELGGKWANRVVRWTSSNPSVATVSQNGVVTAVGTGTTDLVASHPAASASSTAIEIEIT